MTDHVCEKHPDRIAAVSVGEVPMCWQCYLSPEIFNARFGDDFYDRQPGARAHGPPTSTGKAKMKQRSKSQKAKGLFK